MANTSFENVSHAGFIALDDLMVVCIWTSILIYALLANILILAGILRSPSMRNATSYWFIISLSVCDCVMVLISLSHIIPATALHEKFVGVMDLRNVIAIFFYDLFWYTGVLKLGLMAVNRFASIVYPTDYQQLFSKKRTTLIILGLYFFGTCVSIPCLFPCCYTVYNSHWYVTVYHPEDSPYFIVDILVNSFTVVLMIICYTVIILKVRHSRQAITRYNLSLKNQNRTGSRRSRAPSCSTSGKSPRKSISHSHGHGAAPAAVSKREIRLFVQFFVVSLVFLTTWSTWQWLPRISASKWIYFVLTSFFFVNNAVNPTVYLIFNSALRKEVARMVSHLLLCGFPFLHKPGRPDSSTYLLAQGQLGSTLLTRKAQPPSGSGTDNRSSSSPESHEACNKNRLKPHMQTVIANKCAQDADTAVKNGELLCPTSCTYQLPNVDILVFTSTI